MDPLGKDPSGSLKVRRWLYPSHCLLDLMQFPQVGLPSSHLIRRLRQAARHHQPTAPSLGQASPQGRGGWGIFGRRPNLLRQPVFVRFLTADFLDGGFPWLPPAGGGEAHSAPSRSRPYSCDSISMAGTGWLPRGRGRRRMGGLGVETWG